MAEKPRLKKTNEILGSIAAEPSRTSKKKSGASQRRDTSEHRERRAAPETKLPEPDEYEDGEDIELNDQPTLPSAQSLAEKLLAHEDKRRQLNFSKYELPKRRSVPEPETVSFDFGQPENESAAPDHEVAAPESKPAEQAPAASPVPSDSARQADVPRQPEAQPAPVTFEPEVISAPVVTEYTFQSFEGEENDRIVREFEMERAGQNVPEPQRPAQSRPRRRAQQNTRTDENDSERQFDFDSAVEPRGGNPSDVRIQPEVIEPAHPPSEPEDGAATEERDRQEFLKRIANQFEIQFEEKFGQGALPPRDSPHRTSRENTTVKRPAPQSDHGSRPSEPEFMRPAWPGEQNRSKPEIIQPAREEDLAKDVQDRSSGEDFLSYVQRQERERKLAEQRVEPESARMPGADSQAPALDFITKFQQGIRLEEEQRSEDFKETLAQKFERERQRYLKELAFELEEPDEPKPELPQYPRRKLDFQIQPEMHLHGDETPAEKAPQKRDPGPVTYTRGGAARPQVAADDGIFTGISLSAGTTPIQGAAMRKTGEQLLMEHSARTKAAVPNHQGKPTKFNFTFSTPEEEAKNKKREKKPLLPSEAWPRRIVLTAMAAGIFAIGLVVWPLIKYTTLTGSLLNPEESSSEPGGLPVEEDTLNVYNDLNYAQTAKVNNVIFKNTNLTLKNVDVEDYVVIEGIDSKGKIRLEDVNVKTAVSLKSSGVDTLELHNVKANRIIVNNSSTDMIISATGTTDIGVVELRTAATISQSEIGMDSSGIRSMIITPAEAGGSINAKLRGLNLQTLDTSAQESVIAFENDSRAEIMSAEGSLSLTGSGKVVNLAIGAKSGLGASGFEEPGRVTLFVKGVTVTNLNVKSSANLNLSTTVDSVSTSDTVLIGGDGNIGSFTLNPKAGSSERLLTDIAGLNIQSLYSNTPARINITGSARVNTVVADESTYVLGNKVNLLKVNADGVIYENEPDKISVADGIRPPQSKAENPNLDYNVGSPSGTIDTTGEDFATTCSHSRESGGFLLGDGSKNSPFEVSSPAQLAHVSAHPDSHFIQTTDIDVSSDSRFSGGFAMIGSPASPFAGVYDGQGCAISKLRIISPDENVGLFAVNKGQIQNLRIVSGDISSSAANPSYIGSIVGLNIDGGTVRSCSNGANVNGNQNTYTGGVVGYNFGGKVHDCFNYAKVSGVDVVGGMVGYNRQSATLTGSYNVGDIEGRDKVGSVAGANENSTVANCYYLEGTSDFGIGYGNGTATEKTSEELQDPQMAADLTAGNENSLWIPGDASDSAYNYPVLSRPLTNRQ